MSCTCCKITVFPSEMEGWEERGIAVKVPGLAVEVREMRKMRMLAEKGMSAIPFDDLIEIVFEAVADGDDFFTDIDLVAGN